MKFYLTILIALTVSSISVAQNTFASFEDMTFGASATAMDEQPTKTQATYQIGRLDEAADFSLFIPKSFSPNKDGIDDTFQVEGRNIIDFELLVFDQWGGFVYESNDMVNDWDGVAKGKQLRAGPYVYVIKIKTLNGLSKKYSGCLMIEK